MKQIWPYHLMGCLIIWYYWVHRKTSLQFLKTDRRRGNPLNTFIRNILRPFQARYEILNYESRLAEELLEDTVNPPNSDTELLPDDPALPRFMSGRKNWVSQPVHAAPPAARNAAVAPTDETRELAALLDTHTWVLDLFLDVRCPPMTPPFEWAGTWVVQDQLVGYEPRIVLMEKVATTFQTGTRGTNEGANKRPRNAGSNFATSSSQLPDTDSSGLS
ncbi:hypothetical protein TRAPUB_11783 [Trametes pubescens]|uniref:Uncharacterized protein n=1 Tax=Trametes pubescens TaxID=154538 RepID=A0A1M2VVU5_TRAPU|nr:hypothetical protein TRAPUB_11783 [Trametes pubescens]